MTFSRQEGDVIAVAFGKNTINRGQIVTADDAGNGKAAEAGKPVLGVALESTSEVLGETIRVFTEGVFTFKKDGAVAGDLGKKVKVADAETVADVENIDAAFGQIVEVLSETQVLVKLK